MTAARALALMLATATVLTGLLILIVSVVVLFTRVARGEDVSDAGPYVVAWMLGVGILIGGWLVTGSVIDK